MSSPDLKTIVLDNPNPTLYRASYVVKAGRKPAECSLPPFANPIPPLNPIPELNIDKGCLQPFIPEPPIPMPFIPDFNVLVPCPDGFDFDAEYESTDDTITIASGVVTHHRSLTSETLAQIIPYYISGVSAAGAGFVTWTPLPENNPNYIPWPWLVIVRPSLPTVEELAKIESITLYTTGNQDSFKLVIPPPFDDITPGIAFKIRRIGIKTGTVGTKFAMWNNSPTNPNCGGKFTGEIVIPNYTDPGYFSMGATGPSGTTGPSGPQGATGAGSTGSSSRMFPFKIYLSPPNPNMAEGEVFDDTNYPEEYGLYTTLTSEQSATLHAKYDWKTVRIRAAVLFTANGLPYDVEGTDFDAIALDADKQIFDPDDETNIPPFDDSTASIEHVLSPSVDSPDITLFWIVIDPSDHTATIHNSDIEDIPSGDNAWSLYQIAIGRVNISVEGTSFFRQYLRSDIFEPCP